MKEESPATLAQDTQARSIHSCSLTICKLIITSAPLPLIINQIQVGFGWRRYLLR